MKNKLIILTLNWNGADRIKKLITSILPALDGIPFIWFIKDNASKDNSVEIINSFNNPNIKCIVYKDNLQNFSEGCNFLFNEANPNDDDFIMLLNNDIIFNDKSSIKNMLSIIENDNSVGLVGARILYPDGKRLQHAGVYFSKKYNYFPYHYRHQEIDDAASQKNREFQAVTGALALIRAGDYKKVCTTNKSGRVGMDEKYFWSFEDIDLCLSVKYNLNKKIMYCGKTNVYHEESASLKKNPMHKLMMSSNCSVFRKKWEGIYKHDD